MRRSLIRRVLQRSAPALIAAAAVALPIVANASNFILSAPVPATVSAGVKGMMTFHLKMTPAPNIAGGANPTGFITVVRQGDTDPIWCYSGAGPLCNTSSLVNGGIDVHVYMSKLAASPGTLLFQLRDPKSKAPYSNALAVQIHATASSAVSGSHVVNPGNVKPVDKLVVPLNKPLPATASPPSPSPKP